MKLLLFNGPPGSGKDVSGSLVTGILKGGCHTTGFARVLKERTHALYGLVDEVGRPLPYNHYESCKNNPHPDFLGLSPRAAYIAVSETYFKPTHGTHILGEFVLAEARLLRAEPSSRQPTVLCVTDSGFVEECEKLVQLFKPENTCLVRLSRPGCDFSSDSRTYWEPTSDMAGMTVIELPNDGTPLELKSHLCYVLGRMDLL